MPTACTDYKQHTNLSFSPSMFTTSTKPYDIHMHQNHKPQSRHKWYKQKNQISFLLFFSKKKDLQILKQSDENSLFCAM